MAVIQIYKMTIFPSFTQQQQLTTAAGNQLNLITSCEIKEKKKQLRAKLNLNQFIYLNYSLGHCILIYANYILIYFAFKC